MLPWAILLSGVASTPTRMMLPVLNLLSTFAISALLCLTQSLGAQQSTNTDPEPGSFRTNPIDGQEYAWIPPGSFRMGCVPDDEECDDDEKPLHFVEISRGFRMARAHTTVRAYEKFVAATEADMPEAPFFNLEWKEKDHPIVRVKWGQADAFCKWAGGRLPTEAQWEYAARGGEEGFIYPSGNFLTHADANYEDTGGRDRWDYTSPAGSFPPNAYGLYDMAGNVWEWMSDWYHAKSYSHLPSKDPQGPYRGYERVIVSGSWFNVPRVLRISDRFKLYEISRSFDLGFRCVWDGPEE